jgi:hypothetical protein
MKPLRRGDLIEIIDASDVALRAGMVSAIGHVLGLADGKLEVDMFHESIPGKRFLVLYLDEAQWKVDGIHWPVQLKAGSIPLARRMQRLLRRLKKEKHTRMKDSP